MKEKSGGSGNTLLLLVILIILLLIIAFGITKLSDNEERVVADVTVATEQAEAAVTTVTATESVTEATTTTRVSVPELGLSDYDLYSYGAMLIDSDGNAIYSMNSDEQIYPASLTKIMTAIVAIENIDYLDDTISIPGDIYDYIAAEQASTAGFSAYETVTYRDLLYGTLLSSGAECSLALAVYIGGSEEMFVRMMNEKAQELGMENTSFTNVCGLHSYEHYSTVSDIAVLLEYALQNYEFRKIFTSHEYYTETDYQPGGVTLYSTMFSQMSSDYFDGGYILGGKTGFTSEAGLCLASLAEVDGEEYMLVTVGADGTHYTDPYHIYDAYTVYEALAACQQGY